MMHERYDDFDIVVDVVVYVLRGISTEDLEMLAPVQDGDGSAELILKRVLEDVFSFLFSLSFYFPFPFPCDFLFDFLFAWKVF
jgi:hypothetical protein